MPRGCFLCLSGSRLASILTGPRISQSFYFRQKSALSFSHAPIALLAHLLGLLLEEFHRLRVHDFRHLARGHFGTAFRRGLALGSAASSMACTALLTLSRTGSTVSRA